MSNESKTTKSYKMSPDLKDKLEGLFSESGLDTQEAFLEQLAALYELQQLKEGSGSGYRKQIEELEYHLSRPLALFTSMIDTEAAERLKLNQDHAETLESMSEAIDRLEKMIDDLEKEKKAQADELARIVKENDTNVKLVEQLQESVRDKGLIADQRGQEIATLSGIVNEYKAAADENKDLKTEVSRLTALSEKQAEQIAELKNDKEVIDDERERQLEQAAERQREALELLSKQKEAERKEALADLRDKQQDKLEKATEEIRTLYAEIEQLRKNHEQQIREIQQPKGDGKTPPAKK